MDISDGTVADDQFPYGCDYQAKSHGRGRFMHYRGIGNSYPALGGFGYFNAVKASSITGDDLQFRCGIKDG